MTGPDVRIGPSSSIGCPRSSLGRLGETRSEKSGRFTHVGVGKRGTSVLLRVCVLRSGVAGACLIPEMRDFSGHFSTLV